MSASTDPRRRQAPGLICTAVLMTVLDIAIVNVALPSIGRKLHFSPDSPFRERDVSAEQAEELLAA